MDNKTLWSKTFEDFFLFYCRWTVSTLQRWTASARETKEQNTCHTTLTGNRNIV